MVGLYTFFIHNICNSKTYLQMTFETPITRIHHDSQSKYPTPRIKGRLLERQFYICLSGHNCKSLWQPILELWVVNKSKAYIEENHWLRIFLRLLNMMQMRNSCFCCH